VRDFVFIAIAAVLIASGCGSRIEPQSLRTREEAIPASAIKMTPSVDVFPPILHSKEWQDPAPLGAPINTAGAEDSPFVTPDGSALYLFFTPDPNVPPEKQLLDRVTGIYVAKRQGDAWSNPQRVMLQDAGKLALDGCAFVQDDVMWFCSAREGYTGINLFTAQFKDGRWQNWKDAGDKIKEYAVGEMHITADGNELYFHSARAGGKGQFDIWVTRKRNGAWQPPESVAAVNSSENDGWPFVTQDGKELWFTRTYKGSPALFRSKKIGGNWSSPELIASQFAGEPTLDNAGNLYFTHHFFKEGKMIEADIYIARKIAR
jgi:ribosomal protein L24E